MLPSTGVPTKHFTCPRVPNVPPSEEPQMSVLSFHICEVGESSVQLLSCCIQICQHPCRGHGHQSCIPRKAWACPIPCFCFWRKCIWHLPIEENMGGKKNLLPRDFNSPPLACDLTHGPYRLRSYSTICNRKGRRK